MRPIDLPEIEIEQTTDLHDRLVNWMTWCTKYERARTNFPSEIPVVRLMPRSPSNRIHPDELDAWEIEKAVAKLHPPRLKALIRIHYKYMHMPQETRLRQMAVAGFPIKRSRYHDLKREAEGKIKNILTSSDKSA